MTPAIDVRNLTRIYPRKRQEPRTALDGVDLRVEPGEVHGLLGPNGAGKTTLCKILATILLPTAGTASILGHDVVTDTRAVRRLIGVVLGGERGLYGRLTARQNLLYWSALYRQPTRTGRQRVALLLDRVGLADRADDRVETFSRGMKQRLHLARGLIGDPRVVILDEPTTGMDPVAARDFRLLVGELCAGERTVLMTTHDMAEAEAVCDRVSLIDNGVLVATEDPGSLGHWMSRYERVIAHGAPADVVRRLRDLRGVCAVHGTEPGAVRVETDAPGVANEVVRLLVDSGVTEFSVGPPSLEEVYMYVIGERGLGVR